MARLFDIAIFPITSEDRHAMTGADLGLVEVPDFSGLHDELRASFPTEVHTGTYLIKLLYKSMMEFIGGIDNGNDVIADNWLELKENT